MTQPKKPNDGVPASPVPSQFGNAEELTSYRNENFSSNDITAQIEAPVLSVEENNFYNLPTSPASNFVMEILGAGTSVADLPARKQKVNHNAKITVTQNEKQRRIELNSDNAQITVDIPDIEKMTGCNKAAQKLFVLALIKLNEQALHNGALTQDYITFPLQELIDIGFYTTKQSARKGFHSAVDTLSSFQINGKITVAKKSKIEITGFHPFRYGIIENSQCTIFLEPAFNWRSMCEYFTILPHYYFRLPNRASELLYYIFFLARQNADKIKARGYFTIGFRAIQQRLLLPSEIGNRLLYKTIKQPIEEAIAQIEEAHSNVYGNTEFQLLPVCDENASITEYLNNGYLKVTFKGDFKAPFVSLEAKTEKKIEAYKKKQDRIAEKAIAIKMANSMQEAEQNETPEENETTEEPS